MPGPKTIQELAKDKELLKSMATDVYNVLKNTDPKLVEKYPDDKEFIDATQDERKIKNFLDANELIERKKKCAELEDLYNKKGLVTGKIDPGMRRHAAMLLDLSGTPEADKKNIDFLNRLTTREGAQEELNKELLEIAKFDITKLCVNTTEDAIKVYNENFRIFSALFVYHSAIDNGNYNIDQDVKRFLNDNKQILENAGVISGMVMAAASNLYITTPDSLTKADIQKAQKPLTINASQNRAKGIPGYSEINPQSPESEQTTAEFFNCITGKTDFAVFQQTFSKLVEDKIIDKDGMYNTKAFDAKGNEVSMAKGLGLANDAKVEYDYMVEGKLTTLTFDEYVKENNLGITFKKEAPTNIDIVKNKIEKGELILSDKKVLDFIDNDVKKLDEELKVAKGTRSINRNRLIQNRINDILDDNTEIDGCKLQKNNKKSYIGKMKSILEEKHSSRGFFWKFFHKSQFRAEEETLRNIDTLLNKKFTPNEVKSIDEAYDELKGNVQAKIDIENKIELGNKNNEKEVNKLNLGDKVAIKSQEELSKILENATTEKKTEVSKMIQSSNEKVIENKLE